MQPAPSLRFHTGRSPIGQSQGPRQQAGRTKQCGQQPAQYSSANSAIGAQARILMNMNPRNINALPGIARAQTPFAHHTRGA
jgi:hypothetical protein